MGACNTMNDLTINSKDAINILWVIKSTPENVNNAKFLQKYIEKANIIPVTNLKKNLENFDQLIVKKTKNSIKEYFIILTKDDVEHNIKLINLCSKITKVFIFLSQGEYTDTPKLGKKFSVETEFFKVIIKYCQRELETIKYNRKNRIDGKKIYKNFMLILKRFC